jgi:hypothetical protein
MTERSGIQAAIGIEAEKDSPGTVVTLRSYSVNERVDFDDGCRLKKTRTEDQ